MLKNRKKLKKYINDPRLIELSEIIDNKKITNNNISHIYNLLEDNKLSSEEILYYYKKYQNIEIKSSNTLENMILRYGPNKGLIEYEKTKNKSINSLKKAKKGFLYKNGKQLTSRSIDWWKIRYGLTEEEAKQKIHNLSVNGGIKALKTRKQNPKWKERCTTSIEYYLDKGYSIEEAKILLSERQSTFSLEKCIEKHGLIEGTKRFNKRQEKWQSTLNNKTDEEKREINFKRLNFLGVSKESQHFINKLSKHLNKRYNIQKEYFDEKNHEYYLNYNNNFFLYDYMFIIDNIKFIIEYHGIAWHPKENQIDWVSPFGQSYQEAKNKDNLKKMIAENNGFRYFEIFSDYTKSEYDLLIKGIQNEIEN